MTRRELSEHAKTLRDAATALRWIALDGGRSTLLAYVHKGETRVGLAMAPDRCREMAAELDDVAETLEALARR